MKLEEVLKEVLEDVIKEVLEEVCKGVQLEEVLFKEVPKGVDLGEGKERTLE